MSQLDESALVALPGADGEPLEVSEMEAYELRTLLEAEGIETVFEAAEMLPNLPFRLMVRAGDLERAVEIIGAARQTGAEAAEEAEAAGEQAG